ncbi:uncharacterized protein YcbX [Nocardioides salarius]|uniref:Uncharacterized protein YcbX n=1 Tax=Nocardioides salarius TaxID=374513 RepID=A0ABS2MBJ3_9ACTN|nr:MOSC domain-containing protein [Nocardioides salarius]MBM7508546.1 uncharacterized protein YcbX [Nocardioides salarius]
MRVSRVGYAAAKGTRHLARERLVLAADGVVGDRRWCFVDVAARRVLRTVAHPGLVGMVLDEVGDDLALQVPGRAPLRAPASFPGESVTCDYWGREVALELVDGPFAEAASVHLGVSVRLARAPVGGVVYGGSVSLVGAESVAALGDLDPARVRANLVVEAGGAFVEDGWVGRDVAVGSAVVRVASRTPRCAVLDLDPATGTRGPGVLAALTALRGTPTLGVDGHVVRPGLAHPGDPVVVLPTAG